MTNENGQVSLIDAKEHQFILKVQRYTVNNKQYYYLVGGNNKQGNNKQRYCLVDMPSCSEICLQELLL